MSSVPFLDNPPIVYVVRYVRITSSGEVVVEDPNALPRYGGDTALDTAIAGLPTLPRWAQTDFAQAFVNLLPQGRAWPKWPTSNLYTAVQALIGTYARDVPTGVGTAASAGGSANRALALLEDTMPWWNALGAAATVELLAEWQYTLGLPDPCQPADASLDQRVHQAVARFVWLGGQSVPWIVQFAANLGFGITITEFSPFLADSSVADTILADENAAHIWEYTTSDTGTWLFKAGLNTAEEPLGGFGSDVLACEIARIKPAQTEAYQTSTTATLDAGFILDSSRIAGS